MVLICVSANLRPVSVIAARQSLHEVEDPHVPARPKFALEAITTKSDDILAHITSAKSSDLETDAHLVMASKDPDNNRTVSFLMAPSLLWSKQKRPPGRAPPEKAS